MTERCVLLVGTPKGAFVLDGDADRRDWTPPRAAVRGLADPRHLRRARHRRAPRRRRQPLVRAGRLAQRGPRRDLDPFERGPDLRRRRPEGRDGLERDRDRRHDLRGRRARRPVPQPGPGPDVGARRGPDQPSQPRRVAAGRRRPDPPLDRPPPRRPGPRVGRDLGRRRVRDARRRRDLGDAQPAASGPTSSPDPYPEFGQCVHKLVMAADGGEHLYQQNHCGVYRSTDGGAPVGGDHRRACRPSSGSR